jgi:diguanylate cyclase (GGDEF)-like protein
MSRGRTERGSGTRTLAVEVSAPPRPQPATNLPARAVATNPTEQPPQTAVHGALTAISERARAANLERVSAIETALLGAADGDVIGAEETESVIRAAHQIAGSAGTFGHTRASTLAKELEALLADGALADSTALLSAFTAAEQLTEELTKEVEPPIDGAPVGPGHPRRILIAHEDPEQGALLAAAARSSAWASQTVATPDTAVEALDGGRVDALILDPRLSVSEVLSRAAGTQPPTPTLVLIPDDDFFDRVEASRAGADWFVDGSLPPERIMSVVAAGLALRSSERARVLALDDDESLLDHLQLAFGDTDMQIVPVSNPLRFWDRLRDVRPDLVILDLDMPGVSGLEVCRMLRADAQWADLPVLFLTASSDPGTVHGLFAAGADDYVRKPVAGPELVARVENRLERLRLARRLAKTDQRTGLLNRQAFEGAYPTLVRDAALLDQPVAAALIEIDGHEQIVDAHGREAGDAALERIASVLRPRLHDGDLAARWSDSTVAVAMRGMSRDDGIRRIAGVLEELSPERVPGGPRDALSFTAAVAEHGTDGADLATLRRALDTTLHAARSLGGRRVLPAGWRQQTAPDVIDVLLVEDDDVLAEVLCHSLKTRGLRGRHLSDGQVSVERLTGNDPLVARVVLLDVDLPGLNGLDVLRALGESGVLDRTRVVMLTAHGQEADILAALRLGAFDHVAKPFSLPILMHRIRKALET